MLEACIHLAIFDTRLFAYHYVCVSMNRSVLYRIYSRKFSEINILEITMKTIFQKLNFGILSMHARVRVIITGKLL